MNSLRLTRIFCCATPMRSLVAQAAVSQAFQPARVRNPSRPGLSPPRTHLPLSPFLLATYRHLTNPAGSTETKHDPSLSPAGFLQSFDRTVVL